MNVYDTANRLAKELKESEEYNNFKAAKQAVALNPDLNIKIKEFEKRRYESQIKMMQEGKTDEKEIEQIQKMYAKLIEAKFNLLMTDVNKIIGDSIKDVIS